MMLRFAPVGVILIALQTSGQCQPQHGYQPTYYAQPDPCLPCPKPLPPCPPTYQPLPPCPPPNPAPYDPCLAYPKPSNPAPYAPSYQAPYPCSPQYQMSQYGLPVPFPVFYNSQDSKKPLRNGDDDEDDDSPTDSTSHKKHKKKRPDKPDDQDPKDDQTKKDNRRKHNQNHKKHDNGDNPDDNSYEPDASRSGRQMFSSISRQGYAPGRTSSLFSNIGAAAGNLADSLF